MSFAATAIARVVPAFQQIAPLTGGAGQEGEAEILRIGRMLQAQGRL